MHTIYRTTRATLSALGVVALFGAWGLVAALMSGEAVLIPFGVFTGAILFAPPAFRSTWESVGD